MTIKVGMISLGCSKNQVDAERLLAKLAKEGFAICNDMTCLLYTSPSPRDS